MRMRVRLSKIGIPIDGNKSFYSEDVFEKWHKNNTNALYSKINSLGLKHMKHEINIQIKETVYLKT